MKSVKHVVKSVAAADINHLREAAESRLAHAHTAVRQRFAGGAVDEALARAHRRLLQLQAAADALLAALRHAAERARKNGKSGGDLAAAVGRVAAATGEAFGATLEEEAAVARAWEAYAAAEEAALLAPARAQLGGLFSEAEASYSKYLAAVNELGARQGKERLQKATWGEEKAERTHEKVTELLSRKAQMEEEKLAKLEAIADCVEATVGFLLERHSAFRTACFSVAAAAAASAAAADAQADALWPTLLAETEAGWAQLHRPDLFPKPKLRAGGSSGGTVASPRPPAGPFGVPLVVACASPHAIGGAPAVAALLMHRLRHGVDAAGARLAESDGLFRLSADAEERDAFCERLEAAGGAACAAAVAACADAHVLASGLKMFYRKLPEPLVPTRCYRAVVEAGRNLASDREASAEELEELKGLLHSSFDPPHLTCLHALLAFLLEMSTYAAATRMGVSNLAIVFAPNVIRPDESVDPATALADVTPAAQALAAMIRHHQQLFAGRPSPLVAQAEAIDAAGLANPPASAAAAAPTSAPPSDPPLPAAAPPPAAAAPAAAPPPPPLASAAAAAAAAAPPAEGISTSWWYAGEGGERLGPVWGDDLLAMVARGDIPPTTWVFQQGTDDWVSIREAQARIEGIEIQ